MMVERAPDVKNTEQFLKELDHAAAKLAEISKKKAVSNQELNDLITDLHKFNDTFDKSETSFLDGKKFAPEEMKTSIEKALLAIQLFQSNQPGKDKSAQKNVDQAIISLFSSLSIEINTLDKHLRNLGDYKIGRKVEKTSEGKRS